MPFCIDYIAFNALIIKDVYPLPGVDKTLEALYGSRRFTNVDSHALLEKNKAKTAFTTPEECFYFNACRSAYAIPKGTV